MAIPDPSKAGSPFSPLQTGGWNPKTPEINNFFIPEITLRGGYMSQIVHDLWLWYLALALCQASATGDTRA